MSHLASAKVKVGKNPAGIARNAIDQEENKIYVCKSWFKNNFHSRW